MIVVSGMLGITLFQPNTRLALLFLSAGFISLCFQNAKSAMEIPSTKHRLERTVDKPINVMDQIMTANSRRDESLGVQVQNSKREKVEDEILKINDAHKTSEDLFEGDVILDRTDPEDMLLIKLQEETRNQTSSTIINKRQASRKLKWLWHSKQVPYVIATELRTNSVKFKILKAIDTFNKKTCVQFVPKRGGERNYVLFAKKQGCYSRIGRSYSRSGPQIISIGDFCDVEGIILHEMLHSLGFYHEQSRPDRAKNIEILYENIKPGLENQFLKYGHGDIDGLGVNYNFRSIMHYGKNAFSRSPNLNTMQAVGDSKIDLGNIEMSTEDVIELDALYRCKNNVFNSWTAWSSYSPCDSSCYKNKQRFCYGKTPNSCGGKPNRYGIEKGYVKCSSQECPAKVDGHWGAWSKWGKCNKRCNEGMQKRKRTCDNPAPQNYGKSCVDTGKQQRLCIQPRCTLAREDTDFRNSILGIWENDIYDTPGFDWEIGKGATKTEGTGPYEDHTTKTDYYLYIESSGRKDNDVARLVSKILPKTQPKKKCLKFFYHMYGRTTGSLSVFLSSDGQIPKRLFLKTGEQGDDWNTASVTLDTSVPYQLVFEAMVAKPSYSDIAIDDVFIDDGDCDCQDKYMLCKSWAKGGYCKKSFNFMYLYCLRSCNFCGCQNNVKWNCNRWSLKHCKKNPGWMEVFCPVLCQVCACYDKNIFCSYWKKIGACAKNPNYMKDYCRKSCGLCS